MDLFFGLFLILCLFCMVSDILTYKIPNLFVFAIFVLFFVASIANHGMIFMPMKGPLVAFAVCLVVTYGLFVFKMMGAGDAKLISVCCLWTTAYSNTLMFLVFMALSGAILGVLYMKLDRYIQPWRLNTVKQLAAGGPFSWLVNASAQNQNPEETKNQLNDNQSLKKVEQKEQVKIPYAVAIFIGLVISLKFV